MLLKQATRGYGCLGIHPCSRTLRDDRARLYTATASKFAPLQDDSMIMTRTCIAVTADSIQLRPNFPSRFAPCSKPILLSEWYINPPWNLCSSVPVNHLRWGSEGSQSEQGWICTAEYAKLDMQRWICNAAVGV
jgi:hypothetical protein